MKLNQVNEYSLSTYCVQSCMHTPTAVARKCGQILANGLGHGHPVRTSTLLLRVWFTFAYPVLRFLSVSHSATWLLSLFFKETIHICCSLTMCKHVRLCVGMDTRVQTPTDARRGREISQSHSDRGSCAPPDVSTDWQQSLESLCRSSVRSHLLSCLSGLFY